MVNPTPPGVIHLAFEKKIPEGSEEICAVLRVMLERAEAGDFEQVFVLAVERGAENVKMRFSGEISFKLVGAVQKALMYITR